MESYLPYFIIRIQPKGVYIASNSSLEEDRFLRDDSKTRPKIMKAELAYIDPINYYLPTIRFYQPKEHLDQSRLSTSSSTNNTNFLPSMDAERYSFQYQRSIWPIPNLLKFTAVLSQIEMLKHISTTPDCMFV